MDQTEKISKALNLSLYEARVYVALQTSGPLLVRAISKHASIPRTAVYAPLESLLRRGFASKTMFGKRMYYSAVPPEHLLTFLDQQKLLLEQAITGFDESKRIQSTKDAFETTFYRGKHGIKSAGLIFLNDTQEKIWYSFENFDLVTKHVGFEFENFYIQERVKRKIHSKAILSFTEGSPLLDMLMKNNAKELRDTVLLSPHQYPFQTTVVATKGLALLINPNDNPFALLIRNPYVAATFITLHKCLWERYKG